MKKINEYDPEDQNWFWFELGEKGSIAAGKNRVMLAGRVGKRMDQRRS